MAMETVLLALLGLVAVWLVVDAGRERHRLRARMHRAGRRTVGHAGPLGACPSRRIAGSSVPGPHSVEANTGGVGPDPWRYWPLALPATDDSRRHV